MLPQHRHKDALVSWPVTIDLIMPITPLSIAHYTLANALGRGVQDSLNALQSNRSGLRPCDFEDAVLETWIGRVDGLEEAPLPESMAEFECRNNRLARLTLELDGFCRSCRGCRQRVRCRPHRRLHRHQHIRYPRHGKCLSLTQQGDRPLPHDYNPSHSHNIFSPTWFVRQYLGLTGPALAISTACSSSAKVFAAAHRYIESGLCDAAVVGGVDSLCLTTFTVSMRWSLISASPCRPWDVQRDGINIGEAAGFALLQRSRPQDSPRSVARLW